MSMKGDMKGSWVLDMEGDESKAQSQGQDSQITSQNVQESLKYLHYNLYTIIELEISWKLGFEQCVKEILNQIEDDENLSKVIAEFYDSKKSNMTKLVTELSRVHGALVEENIHLIKEVKKNMTKSHSQGQDSQNMPENSSFLFENVEGKILTEHENLQHVFLTKQTIMLIELEFSWKLGFQQCVKEILNVIEQDENLPKIGDIKKSKLTAMVTELSRMHMALADEHVHLIKEVSKNTHKSTTPIKTEHVDSSTSTSAQMSKTPEFKTPVGYEFTLDTSGGGFRFSTREGSESSFALSSNPDQLESTKKHLNPPVKFKNDESKVKETKLHDPEPEVSVLRKKISTLEKKQLTLKKKIQDLTDENAILEAEKANAAELKLTVAETNRRYEKMFGVLEASRQQVIKSDEENKNLKNELTNKILGITGRLQTEYDKVEAQNLKLHEEVALGLTEIAKRDEQIIELSTQIDQLKNSHATEEDKWNTDIERLEMELKEKCELVDDLNKKHDALKICTDELKLKLKGVELDSEREVTSKDAV
uniref:Uncharacterized protein n=1 Tax=Lactuca sativa TaxID=4236 RepID=A0A9R1XSG4_LACSA|nr:hypothetical protein LSAT_V11C200097280 [Lactuca sativa]